MGGVTEVWTNFGIQILVFFSLVFQVLLFIIPIARRHKWMVQREYLATLYKLLLWLAYQLADTTAIYVLGHMAFSARTSGEHKQLMAQWAAVLLVHLGGQDTITAYALEDNRLWKRHLFTLLVQTAGVLYVLITHGGRHDLQAASALMFIVGFLKIAERIYVLWSSDIGKFGDLLRKIRQREMDLLMIGSSPREYAREQVFYPEEDLKQAHNLLSWCMGQFIYDHRQVRPSLYQAEVMRWFRDHNKLYELVELQLSLVHDKLYTKAAAIHTWHGCLIRAFSWLATVIASTLFLSRSGSTKPYSSLDASVTYALLAGAFLLETASLLKAAGSTWTYQILDSESTRRQARPPSGWQHGLQRVVSCLRQLVKAAERSRRWPGLVGWCSGGTYMCQWPPQYVPDLVSVSETTKISVLKHIEEMVKGCGNDEAKLRNYRGELSLQELYPSSSDIQLPEDNMKKAIIDDIMKTVTETEFDESMLIWHYATKKVHDDITSLLYLPLVPGHRRPTENERLLDSDISRLHDYMLYLFMKQPHMLPTPVRHSLYSDFGVARKVNELSQNMDLLLQRRLTDDEKLLEVILGVWVEMLCYAGSHCNRDSHARELSNGSGEFSTVVWIVRNALFYIRPRSIGPVNNEPAAPSSEN